MKPFGSPGRIFREVHCRDGELDVVRVQGSTPAVYRHLDLPARVKLRVVSNLPF